MSEHSEPWTVTIDYQNFWEIDGQGHLSGWGVGDLADLRDAISAALDKH